MASEIFNSISGYSVGIPPINVVDANGNVVSNVFTTGNVFANVIYSDNFRFANGQPYAGAAAGSNTEVQFNNDNSLGADNTFTFDSRTSLLSVKNLAVTGITNLGDVSNVKITGGVDGYFLQTDGEGNLAWAVAGGGSGNGSPGGSNTQIQYNDNGVFGGSTGLTFNEVTKTLTTNNVVANTFTGSLYGHANTASTVTINAQPNITSVGTLTTLVVSGNVTVGNISGANTITSNYFSGNAYRLSSIPAANLVGSVPLAAKVSSNSQPNITSVGILTSLEVYGNIDAGYLNVGANIEANNAILAGQLHSTGANIVGNLVVGETSLTLGNIYAANTARIDLGNISNIHILGGAPNYSLVTDGYGNLSWSSVGGTVVPGAPVNSVQFNNNGMFGGTSYFTYDDSIKTVQIGGNLIANTLQLGAGAYKWSRSEIYFATTASMGANQVLYSVPALNLAGVEFDIIATEPVAPRRQKCKISSLYYQGNIQYSEYASLLINGGVGSYDVYYDPGDVVNPPRLQLRITPNTNRPTTYKMLITVFADS